MKKELAYADVTEELCRKCAKCCMETLIPVALDDRTYEYFEAVGLEVARDPDDPEAGVLNAGVCRHLEKYGEIYGCGVYGDRPRLCADYNCVAWAKASGEESGIVRYALEIYNKNNGNV